LTSPLIEGKEKKMPLIQSAKKALRRDKKRTIVNLKIKNKMKIALKKAKKKTTKKNLSLAYSAIDKALKKKIIHKNKAARLKSRLMRKS
jgi:small subunit ribosomal protein S20